MEAALHAPPRSGQLLLLRMLAFGIFCSAAVVIISRLTN